MPTFEPGMAADVTARGKGSSPVTLFLCGDVMTGRGVDQVLPRPGDPALHEPYVRDAREYVRIAERSSGRIPRPVDFSYPWGDALEELSRVSPDLRVVNLETGITTSGEFWPGKGIHYRMHPGNARCLTAAGIDACSLANNHVLDWGYDGLAETMDTLRSAGIRFAGAGANRREAEEPVVCGTRATVRAVLYALCDVSSGVPPGWAAGESTPGVNLVPGFSGRAVRGVSEQLRRVSRPGDILVVSIHWGGNWGYEIPRAHRDFAHQLIDRAGVDVVHGHSSHHALPVELYRGKLILYGCGDFINDYEGIRGHEEYRGDLAVMYFPRIDQATGNLMELRMVLLRRDRFRLQRASSADTAWLQDTLNRYAAAHGTRVARYGRNRLQVRPAGRSSPGVAPF
jgi:poly-gamma-glutamate synthesis protein (capsule biosynthesis protein)